MNFGFEFFLPLNIAYLNYYTVEWVKNMLFQMQQVWKLHGTKHVTYKTRFCKLRAAKRFFFFRNASLNHEHLLVFEDKRTFFGIVVNSMRLDYIVYIFLDQETLIIILQCRGNLYFYSTNREYVWKLILQTLKVGHHHLTMHGNTVFKCILLIYLLFITIYIIRYLLY